MRPEAEEWISKAEGNWQVANRELGTSAPVWDVICFLAQQCAEHYLKAFLDENRIDFRKTHDLAFLHKLSQGLLPELDAYRQDLIYLATIGIEARYPGMNTNKKIAGDMLLIAGEVRSIIRSKLGLS